ncbi:DUF2380 domain-containing protein [Amaricoccus macauensis]|uniref:DUF2380 domain-containing protein n=1 Tax=Amaricoccus macauensis TaxID=57001 RepID=UPI003C7B8EE4
MLKLLVALAALGLAGTATADTLAVMPVMFLDTSGEDEDQSAAHAARLAAMGDALVRDLAADYDAVVLIPEGDLQARCPGEAPDCLVGLARAAEADVALFAAVLKTSTLIMRMYVNVVDVAQGQVITQRELNFRGDTDESWQRAEQFLVRNLRER